MSRKRKQARLALWSFLMSFVGMYLGALGLSDLNYLVALVGPAAGLVILLTGFSLIRRAPVDDPIRDVYDGLVEMWADYKARLRFRPQDAGHKPNRLPNG